MDALQIKLCDIQGRLFELSDKEYGDFAARTLPGIDRKSIIGVRAPLIKKLARELDRDKADVFLSALPHSFFDENYLHAALICRIKDLGECMDRTERFLPFIDNWAVCDTLSPPVFGKNKKELLKKAELWTGSEHTYTVRYGIGAFMRWFLDEDFDDGYAERISRIRSEEYYINMMIAWYFATALAKQYESTVKYIEEKKLDPWTHNKAIQKACESFRVTDAHKAYLKTLKIKKYSA